MMQLLVLEVFYWSRGLLTKNLYY